jgi:iron(III) transport system substrate-binding protein
MKRTTASGFVAVLVLAAAAFATPAAAQTESLEELYKKAQKEEGGVNCYCTLAQINAEKIYPVFEKRFPGIRVNHIDATADKLSARAITEARGGRVIADIAEFALESLLNLQDQGLLLDKLVPEAAAYPNSLKGSHWVASNAIYIVGAWNTEKVKKEEEPKIFEDFAGARWKGRLIGEPRDVEVLIALTQKLGSEKARAVLAKIAANNPEFHGGHSQLAELLVAGQAAACFSCYSHHFPSRIKKGAPLGFSITEGAATIVALGVLKNAPHPNTATLFARWVLSEEGQAAYAKGGRTPAHPKVEPVDKIRPQKNYTIGAQETREFSKYEKIWKEVFKLR